jgi:endoribonuclease L-PSP
MGKQAIGGQFMLGSGAKVPFSRAMRAGDLVFVSGQMATDSSGRIIEGGIEAQTRQVFENIKAILAEAGCTLFRRGQVHLLDRRRARLRPLQRDLRRVFPKRSAGPLDHGLPSGAGRQAGSRGDRVQALVTFDPGRRWP